MLNLRILLAARFPKFCLCLLSLSVLIVAEPLLAKEISAISEVSLPVRNESTAERVRASRLALAEVLLRINGNKAVLESSAVSEMLGNTSRYLLRFSYEGIELEQGDMLLQEYPLPEDQSKAPEVEKGQFKLLTLVFDKTLIVNDLQAAQLAVWGSNRPEVMLWWVEEKGAQRQVLSESGEAEAVQGFRFFARQRAIPIKFPLMDLQDKRQIRISDLWGGYSDSIKAANTRYGAKNWVMGKHYYESGQWKASWTVGLLGKERRFTAQSARVEGLQKAVIGNIANLFASEYGVVSSGDASEFFMQVVGLGSLDDYNELRDYLKNLFVVANLELVHLKGDAVVFRVTLKEDLAKFERLLSLERKLGKLVFENDAEALDFLKPQMAVPDEAPVEDSVLEEAETQADDTNSTELAEDETASAEEEQPGNEETVEQAAPHTESTVESVKTPMQTIRYQWLH